MLRLFLISALAAGSLGLSVAWGQINRASDPAAWNPSSGDIERGRAVVVGAFNRNPGGACFQCHGMDGKGDAAAVFPRLTDQVYKYLYDSLKDYASGVRQNPVMSPIAQALSDQDMRDVSAYYAAQKRADYGPQPPISPELIARGGSIAAIGHAGRGVQGCINCHGPDGVGLPPTYPYLAGQYAAYLEAQLRAWQTGERKGDGFGIMENIAKRMSDEEIRAVSAYYASIRPPSVTPERAEAAAPMVPLPPSPSPPQGR